MFETVTLQATGETAVTGYTVEIANFRSGRETVAFNGTLKSDGRTVAMIQNDGMGGETVVAFTSDAEEAQFEDYVGLWDFGWSVNGLQSMPHTIETVVDTLAYETMTVMARRKRSLQ